MRLIQITIPISFQSQSTSISVDINASLLHKVFTVKHLQELEKLFASRTQLKFYRLIFLNY